MATLTDYKGLQVLSGTPTGAGGAAINDDLKSIVDWHPKANWGATTDPTATDDADSDYQVGSLWLNTTSRKLFVCADATATAAKWQLVPYLVSDGSAANAKPQLAGDLDVNGYTISSSGDGNVVVDPDGTGAVYVTSNVGIGTSSPDVMLHVRDTASGNGNAIVRMQGLGQTTGTRLGRAEFFNSRTAGPGPNVAGWIGGFSSEPAGAGCYLVFATMGGQGSEGEDAPERMRLTEDGILRLSGEPGGENADVLLTAMQFYNNGIEDESSVTLEPQVVGQFSAFSAEESGAGCYMTWATTDGSTDPPPERMRLTQDGDLGLGTNDPKARLHATGSTILGADDSAVANGDLGNGEVNISVDETGHNLTFKVKYSDGTTIKSGTVALA